MSRWPCVPNPAPAFTRSSLITRSARKPMCRESWYSPNEKVWRLSSQPQSVRPLSSADRTRITLAFYRGEAGMTRSALAA